MRGMIVAIAVAALGLGAAASLAGDRSAGAHPHFDDQGVLRWETTLADSLKTAKKQNKLVLVEYGREA